MDADVALCLLDVGSYSNMWLNPPALYPEVAIQNDRFILGRFHT